MLLKASVGSGSRKLNTADPVMKASMDGSVHNSIKKHLNKMVSRYDHQKTDKNDRATVD